MNKKVLIGLTILIILLIGTSYAWWVWNSTTNTNVSLTVDGINVTYNGGSDITGIDLIPVSSKEKGVSDNTAIKKTVTASSNKTLYMDLNLKLEILPDGLKDESFVWELYNGTSKVSNGNFASVNQGDTIKLAKSQTITSTTTTYNLYIWIDANQTNSNSMMNQTFKFVLSANGTDDATIYPNSPDLVDGLIPVTYQTKSCEEIDSPTYEDFPDCYDKRYSELTMSKLTNFCVLGEMGTEETCPTMLSEMIKNGSYYFEEYDQTITLEEVFTIYEEQIGEIDKGFEYILNESNITLLLTKADVNSKWYDYTNKQWANAVLVSNSNRNSDGTDKFSVGEVIEESEILAHYVWIPRYKYKVWNINKQIGVDSYDAETKGIDIVFEDGTQTTGTITCNDYDFSITNGSLSQTCNGNNGDYYTHPAFTFGSDELKGIWVGKFLISADLTVADQQGVSFDNQPVRIKPNVDILNTFTPNYFRNIIQSMNSARNEYGLNTTSDSHMLKNMEWAAVAYLTHSNYGRCSNGSCENVFPNSYEVLELELNFGFELKAGCGPQSKNNINKGEICNIYTSELGQLASTTGNMYGVYDIVDANEYVMGNMSAETGRYIYNSYADEFEFSETTAKYVDTYAYGTTSSDQNSYNRSRLGDGMGEIINESGYPWNSGKQAHFAYSTDKWFIRGFSRANSLSIFPFGADYGLGDNYGNTARSVLVRAS